MIGIEFDEEKFILVRIKGKSIVEFAEEEMDLLERYRKYKIKAVFRGKKIIGKLYSGRAKKKDFMKNFGDNFYILKRNFKKDKKIYTFLAGVPLTILSIAEALLPEKTIRLDFPPFVLYDILYYLDLLEKEEEVLALHKTGNIVYYLIVNNGLPVYASSFPSEPDPEEKLREFFKIFFEEGTPPIYLTGDFDAPEVALLKDLAMDGVVEALDLTKIFDVRVPAPQSPQRYSIAIGVTL